MTVAQRLEFVDARGELGLAQPQRRFRVAQCLLATAQRRRQRLREVALALLAPHGFGERLVTRRHDAVAFGQRRPRGI